MKSEQKRIKHWLRLERKKNYRDYSFIYYDDSSIPPLGGCGSDFLPRSIVRAISLAMLSDKKKK